MVVSVVDVVVVAEAAGFKKFIRRLSVHEG